MTLSLQDYVKSPTALSNHPAMVWANKTFKFQVITDDIQRRLDAENNQFKSVLTRVGFYMAAAVTTALVAGAIFQLGLILAGSMSANSIAHYAVFILLPFAAQLTLMLHDYNRRNEIQANKKVTDEAFTAWTAPRAEIVQWLGEREAHSKEMYALGAATTPDANMQALKSIEKAAKEANDTYAKICGLTPIQEYVITGRKV